MREFRYERATDPAGAVATLAAAPEGAYLGGGTNLVDLMKLGVATPELLVDVTRLPHRQIQETRHGGQDPKSAFDECRSDRGIVVRVVFRGGKAPISGAAEKGEDTNGGMQMLFRFC